MIKLITHTATLLGKAPLSGDSERQLAVYLPPNYDDKRKAPYPVIFVLPGFGQTPEKFLMSSSVFQKSLTVQLDAAIENNTLPPIIIAFPDGSAAFGHGQFVNSPATGNHMDYICDQLVPLVDERFHTHQSANFRAIVGHSSGGFGALAIGMRRPDVFSHIFSSAGDSYYEALYPPCITGAINDFNAAGGIATFLQTFLSHPNPASISKTAFNTMMLCAMAPIYAPNLENAPLYGDLFFDINTGAIIPEIWAKYVAWDPVHMVDQHIDNLKQLSSIHLACGLQDEYGMQWGHRQIAAKLNTAGIAYALEEFPGGHGGQGWRMLGYLQTLSSALSKS